MVVTAGKGSAVDDCVVATGVVVLWFSSSFVVASSRFVGREVRL